MTTKANVPIATKQAPTCLFAADAKWQNTVTPSVSRTIGHTIREYADIQKYYGGATDGLQTKTLTE